VEAALTPGRRLAAAVPSAGAEIALQNPNGYREVNVRGLRPWLAALVASLAPQAESFAVRFVGDRAMRRLNREFRGKDATTDVLSFPGGTTMEGRHLGDVVISLPAARRQTPAAEPVEREVRRLLLHGVLHCLGYDHETDDGEMESVEASLRRQWIGVDHVL
jgi:probable rRNA maturation factor